jgi:hypothetical protein
MSQHNNFSVKERIVLDFESVFPILFLTGLIGVIIMVIKKVSERKNRLINNRKERLLIHPNMYPTPTSLKDKIEIIDRKIRKKPNGIIEWEPITPKPKKNIIKFILKQWQFWIIITIFALSIIFAIINSSNVISQPQQASMQQPIQTQHIADVQQQIENNLSSGQTLAQQLMNSSSIIIALFTITGVVIIIFTIQHLIKG